MNLGMLSAFGFLKLSCTLFIDCFVKPKKKFCQSGSRTSDSDEEEYKPAVKTNRKTKPFLKKGVKYMVRVLPPRPIEKPQMSLFAYFLNNKRRTRSPDCKMPTLTQDRVDSITQRGLDQVKRRGPMPSNKPPVMQSRDWRNQTCVGPATPVKGPYCKTPVIPMDIESQYSLSSDDYPCDSISNDGSESPCVEDLDTVSLDSPRPCLETSANKLGVNPTFFASKSAEEEEEREDDDGFEGAFQSARTGQRLRRIHSIVETNASFKHKAQGSSRQNLLLNPAFGSIEKEENEEVEMETKLKSLKSVIKDGCRASSSVLVESKYIGHTSFNPTYGDLSPSESSSSESSDSELPDGPGEMHFSDKSSGKVLEDGGVVPQDGAESLNGNLQTRLTLSIPKIALERVSLGPEMPPNNMGTLTWRNVAYSQSSESEEEDYRKGNTPKEGPFASEFSKRFPESFPTPFPSPFESSILSPTSSSVAESLSNSIAEEAVNRGVQRKTPKLEDGPTDQTPFHSSTSFPRSHSVKTFEEVDLHSREVDVERSVQDSDSTSSKPSFTNCVPNAKQDRAIVVGIKAQKTPPMKKATKKAGANLRHTRWFLRSLRLFVSRFDPFGQTMDKQK